MLIAPCSGNTIAKLANGIIDTPATMAAKSHLRNNNPVVIAISTNDGLAGSAENIGKLLNRNNYYVVPFRQDNPITKPRSIVADFNMIVNRIRRNENLEDILDDYAASTNLDDIKYFAEIFRYAKRSGGDVIGIIKQTSHIIHEKAEVQQQIDTIITGKRLEQRVMVCMPLVITLYLRLTSPEYIDVLYGNVMGIIVMTICLLIYAAAVMLAQKITDINI